jgi:hypothetical protein
MIAALFVDERGCYADLDDVEAWGTRRDARRYTGPYPVVAHPQCARLGRFWFGGPRKERGADGGCFRSALQAVRYFGGVLEHPAASSAWEAFGLNTPPRAGRWVSADWQGGWTCCVDQGHYGHAGQKATWLYAVGVDLPSLTWGKAPRRIELPDGETPEQRRRRVRTGTVQKLSKRQRAATPIPFRDLLLSMARSADEELSDVG